MEFTALEVWIVRTAIAQSAAGSVAEMMARGRLLEMMEFTDEEKAAIGWTGGDAPLFDSAATITRPLTEKQAAKLRGILCEMIPAFRIQIHAHVESALRKLGWSPAEDE